MSVIIPGYNYDIFISYRQKDNKYDGWVSEFVDHLKSEIEATFKEEISVYFDNNPHDGLLETHDVDDSLKEKIKCLIFIPVVSRTYCDPKSFAWEHEFKAFVEQASRDQFGLKVKLPNGNVALRVLPVQIHELKADDKSLVESVLGGFLRPVEFVYAEPGVNRPLSPGDSEEKNMYRISYRNQVNKVANAIDEVISGLIREAESGSEVAESEIAPQPVLREGLLQKVRQPKNEKKKMVFTFSSSVIILVLAAIYIFAGGSTLPFSKRDWIIITDFENLTDNPVFDKSLYTAFSLSTGQSRYVNVFSKARMMETLARMKIGDQKFIDEDIGREMAIREGIGLYLVPSISKAGSSYAITAKILETKTGDLLKSEVLYASEENDILPVIGKISRKIRKDLGESRYNISLQDKPLGKVTTSSLDALKQFSLGIESHLAADFREARKYYENALRIDTGFTAAKASLGNILIQKFNDPGGKILLGEALRNVENLTDREKYGIIAFHAEHVEKDYHKAIENIEVLKRLYPDDPVVHNNLGWYNQQIRQYDIALREYKEAVRINPDQGLTYSGILWIYGEFLGMIDSVMVWGEKMISDNPENPWGYFYYGSAWFCRDSISRSITCFKKALEINPDFRDDQYRLSHAYRHLENYDKAIKELEKILEKYPGDASAYYDMGINYQAMGKFQEARKWYLKFKKIVEETWISEFSDYYGTYASLAAVAARLDEKELSQQMLKKAMSLDSTQYLRFAEVLCVQGDIPGALKYLGSAIDNGYRDLYWLKVSADLSALRYDIRYWNLINRIDK
ncbi:MAG: tetratricopeptide repeat protein [Bacteroidales bacterium]|nr:tetratricopeptide repeat protein [Bacteroidales bacterium]